MSQTMAQNGFYEPAITPALTPHPEEQLVDVAFQAVSGPQARVGKVEVTGDPGMSVQEFCRHGHLKIGAHVDHDTGNRALAGVLKHYQAQERLEAEITIRSGRQESRFQFLSQPWPGRQGTGAGREHRPGTRQAHRSCL
jgi:outer membrane protein assembly factor BamA